MKPFVSAKQFDAFTERWAPSIITGMFVFSLTMLACLFVFIFAMSFVGLIAFLLACLSLGP